MEYKLYVDGIHGDYPAIQAMLDEGEGCVYLPAPKALYKISRCLKIHSDRELRLDKFTVVRLADAANCCMLENADPEHYGPLIDRGSKLDINNLSISGLVRNENICFEPTIGIGENTKINHMLISNCVQTCPENAKTEFLECKGEIKSGKLQDITVNGKTVFDKKF